MLALSQTISHSTHSACTILIAPAFAIIFKQQAATGPHALQREQLQLAAIVFLRIDVADTLAQRQACSGANQQRQFFQRRIKDDPLTSREPLVAIKVVPAVLIGTGSQTRR